LSFRKGIFALLVAALLLPAGFAQSVVSVSKDNKAEPRAAAATPFAVGERLEYEVSWSSFIVAGELVLETKERREIEGVDAYHVTAEAQSVGLVNLTVLKVKDVYDSFINATTLQPFRAEKTSRHGKKREQGAITFDQKAGKATLEDGKQIEIPQGTYDLASLLYAIRRIDLKSNKPQRLTLIEDGKLYDLSVEIEGREKLPTRTGNYNVVRVATKSLSNRNKDPYQLKMYLTDDAERLPVLITATPTWGQVRVELVQATGTKQR
jgi:hypothetical protein